jgi:hypothetical protein
MKHTLLVLIACLLASCTGGNPRDTSKADALAIAEKIIYVKEKRSGLCFGMVTTSSAGYAGPVANTSITLIPCEKVAHLLIE